MDLPTDAGKMSPLRWDVGFYTTAVGAALVTGLPGCAPMGETAFDFGLCEFGGSSLPLFSLAAQRSARRHNTAANKLKQVPARLDVTE